MDAVVKIYRLHPAATSVWGGGGGGVGGHPSVSGGGRVGGVILARRRGFLASLPPAV